MSTLAYLNRMIRRDVPAVDALQLLVDAPWQITAYVGAKHPHDYTDVAAAVSSVLRREIHVTCIFSVHPMSECPPAVPSARLAPRLQIAALANEQMRRPEYLAGLVRTVPKLTRLRIESRHDRRQAFLVADHNGQASPAFLQEVRDAVSAITYAGAPIEIEPLPSTAYGNDLQNAGFLMPRRTQSLVEATELDESNFVDKIRNLVERDQIADIRHIDDFAGTKLLATPALNGALPLPSLLAYYDRVYVEMPVVRDTAGIEEYYKARFKVSQDDFFAFAKAGKVVPIFKFNFGAYAEGIVEPWLSRLELPYLSPRALDFLAARHLWNTNPLIKALRDNPEFAHSVDAIVKRKDDNGPIGRATQEFLNWNLIAAVSFEGIAYHRGTLALGNLSSGAPVAYHMANARDLFKSEAVAQTITIETFGAVQDLALAQAFGASLCESMLLNDAVLGMVVNAMCAGGLGHEAADESALVRRLDRLVPALELHFASDVPAAEYVALFDESETRRIRSIIAQLLDGKGSSSAEDELRGRVQDLNRAVSRIRRNALEVSVADIVGSIAPIGASSSVPTLAVASGVLNSSLVPKVVTKLGGVIAERLNMTTTIDSIRDALNRVPPGTTRVYKLRRKLGR